MDDTEPQSSCFKPEKVLIQYLQTKFKLDQCSSQMLEELIHSFITGLNQRWKKCHRNKNVFLKKYNEWLNTTITINNLDLPSKSCGRSDKKIGRPSKKFSSSGLKSKRRKVRSLLMERSLSELTHATHLKLRQSGKRDAAGMLKQLTESSSVAAWLSETVLRGRGPGASGFESHRRGRIFSKGGTSAGPWMCVYVFQGLTVGWWKEERHSSDITARSAGFESQAGWASHGCLCLYSCCGVQKKEEGEERVGVGSRGKYPGAPPHHIGKKRRKKPTARYLIGP
jgi:hypothetical protein